MFNRKKRCAPLWRGWRSQQRLRGSKHNRGSPGNGECRKRATLQAVTQLPYRCPDSAKSDVLNSYQGLLPPYRGSDDVGTAESYASNSTRQYLPAGMKTLTASIVVANIMESLPQAAARSHLPAAAITTNRPSYPHRGSGSGKHRKERSLKPLPDPFTPTPAVIGRR